MTVTQADGKPVEEHSLALPKHKKNLDIGNKTTTFSAKMYVEQEDAASFAPNEEVTFMDWGNAYVLKAPDASAPIKTLDVQLHLEGDFKKTSKKVHWLALAASAPVVEVTLIDYDYLITKKKIEEEDDWTSFINPVTEFRTEAYADANVRNVKQGDIIQFERKGFYICDKVASAENPKMEFILIPDGKASSVNLKAKAPAAEPKPKKDVAAKKAAPPQGAFPTGAGLPELAPTEAQHYTLDSRGLPIAVTTKVGPFVDVTGFAG